MIWKRMFYDIGFHISRYDKDLVIFADGVFEGAIFRSKNFRYVLPELPNNIQRLAEFVNSVCFKPPVRVQICPASDAQLLPAEESGVFPHIG